MGNRAVITFDKNPTKHSVGIYLHWNGGAESVYAFAKALDRYKVRDGNDASYQLARAIQLIGNLFGGTTSVGVDTLENLDTDNGDNGLFIVTRENGKLTIEQGEGKHFGPIDKYFTTLNIDELAKHPYNVPDKNGEDMATNIHKTNGTAFSKA